MAEMDRLISRFGPKSVHSAHIWQLNGLFWLRSLVDLSISAFFALFTSGCAKYGRYGQPEGSVSVRVRADERARAQASGRSYERCERVWARGCERAWTRERVGGRFERMGERRLNHEHRRRRTGARGIYCHSLTSGSRCTPASSMTRSCTSAIRASTSVAVAPPVFTTKPACLVDTCAPPTDVPCKPAS